MLHRDLAVRNVLLGEGNVVKLGDFGQARYLQEGESEWKLDRVARLPVRYMPPESLTLKRFSLKTDVWAFGITMWEIATFGDLPYKSEGIEAEGVKDYVLSGKRPTFPPVRHTANVLRDSCSLQMNGIDDVSGHGGEAWTAWRDLTRDCLHASPSARPSMAQLHTALADLRDAQAAALPPMRELGSLLAAPP